MRQFSWLRNYAQVDTTSVLENTVAVQWHDGHESEYNVTWLRVNCPSSLHKSGQKVVTPRDVDPALRPAEIVYPKGSNEVTITWSDGHVSQYMAGWLRAHDNSPSGLHDRSHSSWPIALYSWESIQKVNAQDYLTDDLALYRTLKKVNRNGVCLLTDVGTEEGTVLDLARRVSPLSHTMLYGDSFDVISSERSSNIAYSSEALDLHMDLVYYESPPGLQYLHCVEFGDSVEGGELVLLDGFEAANHFRKEYPEMFEVLCRVPATFHKVRKDATHDPNEDRNRTALEPARMVYQRPHFQVDSNSNILGVFWGPMFEGALLCSPEDVVPYYEAYRAFQGVLEGSQFAKDHTVVKRLKPGECVVFNNRRMLHGRRSYSGKGVRLMQGCYVNIDDFMNKLSILHVQQPASDDPVMNQLTRAGNGSLPHVDY